MDLHAKANNGDAAVVEVVDGIEDGADDSDDAMQNSKPS